MLFYPRLLHVVGTVHHTLDRLMPIFVGACRLLLLLLVVVVVVVGVVGLEGGEEKMGEEEKERKREREQVSEEKAEGKERERRNKTNKQLTIFLQPRICTTIYEFSQSVKSERWSAITIFLQKVRRE